MQTNTKISHCESLLDRHAVNRNTHLVVAWYEMSSLGSSLYFRSVSLYIYIYIYKLVEVYRCIWPREQNRMKEKDVRRGVLKYT